MKPKQIEDRCKITKKDFDNLHLYCADSINVYSEWEEPTVIISDGPYGINGFPGDLLSHQGLAEWYEPHIEKWSRYSSPLTTLWFWNTEVGWATVHPILEKHGWKYVSCCVWDKGMSHVAGNTNTKTIRHLPVVTEVCVQYTKTPTFCVNGKILSMKEWLRFEWERTGLPFSKTNEACNVVDAATRKYFTKCHLWYMPPAEAFEKIVAYANTYGSKKEKPFFSLDGKNSLTKTDWEKLRSKFYCPIGVTNVWQTPQLRNTERLKNKQKAIHLNQKPLELIKRIINMTSDENDVIWDPFGGLCSSAIASLELNRKCYSAEINPSVFEIASERIQQALQNRSQDLFQNRFIA